MPLGYELFAGNKTAVITGKEIVSTIVATMESRLARRSASGS